uniref:Phorbol-ester/DAG-type domain-containing protein n=1 Tax=Trichogramma kaykai TaxID=54128 RepID=A0ABD2WIJ7_9HYME
MPECARCNSNLTREYRQCNACHKCVHHGCAAPYLRKKGTNACCLRAFAIKDDNVISEIQAESSRASIVTKSASANARKVTLDKAHGLVEDNTVNPPTSLCDTEMSKLPEEVPAWFKDLVKNRCLTHNYDVFAMGETFLTSEIADSRVRLEGYNIFTNSRKGKEGGGGEGGGPCTSEVVIILKFSSNQTQITTTRRNFSFWS